MRAHHYVKSSRRRQQCHRKLNSNFCSVTSSTVLWSVCRDSEIWISMSIILNFARVSVSFGLSQYRKGIDCRKNNGTWQSQRVWEKRKPSPVRLPLLRQRLQQEQDNVQDACIAGLITEPQLTLVCAITNRQMIARPESSAGLERSRDVQGRGYAPPQDNFFDAPWKMYFFPYSKHV